MTLEESIGLYRQKYIDTFNMEYSQLSAWLEELLEFKKAYPCKCGALGRPPHTCPYAEDIGGDYETLCDCCDDCAWQCAQDI